MKTYQLLNKKALLLQNSFIVSSQVHNNKFYGPLINTIKFNYTQKPSILSIISYRFSKYIKFITKLNIHFSLVSLKSHSQHMTQLFGYSS